jgi:hypothetical protein
MNITRITHLFRAYFIENKKMLLIGCLIVFAAAIVDLTLSYHAELSPIAAFFIIFWTAGRFFQPSLKRNNSTHFFNLPVSAGEKLIVVIVITLVFSIVIALLFQAGAYTGYYAVRPILNPVESNMYQERGLSVNDLWNIQEHLYFAVVLFVFLFGSVYFKKNAFWKTFACGTGFFIGIGLYLLALLRLSFGNISEIGAETTVGLRDYSFLENNHFIPIALILFFLSLTYLRLRETEV